MSSLPGFSPSAAVEQVRRNLAQMPDLVPMVIEVEVDSLAQLQEVLPAAPDVPRGPNGPR